jgi:DNA modification methylase
MRGRGTVLNQVLTGDCRRVMRELIEARFRANCIVTSPPYWGLRDYGVQGAHGLERTWVRHVARMRYTFRLARELLAKDGVLWLNYGDSYAGNPGGYQDKNVLRRRSRTYSQVTKTKKRGNGLKPKDLVGMPWRVAFALQADGWWLRSDVIWSKPNPMPESVYDRPTKSHEYVFLFSKAAKYHYDAEAIAEPSSPDSHARARRAHSGYAPPGQHEHEGWAARGINPKAKKPPSGWDAESIGHRERTGRYRKTDAKAQIKGGDRISGFNERWKNREIVGEHGPKDDARVTQGLRDSTKFGRGAGWRNKQNESFSAAVTQLVERRNCRTVWSVPTQPYEGAHFATFPEELVARCVLAGSRPGDTIFDPFMGSGTVAKVAIELGRNFLGIELNPEYVAMAEARARTTIGLQL